MENWQKIALVGGGFLAFSLLPLWRSGSNNEVSLAEFARNHTVFGDGNYNEMYE